LLILAATAAIATPLFIGTADEKKLDTAFAELLSAAEFARTESRRSGTATGFCIDSMERLAVVSMQTPNALEVAATALDDAVLHPIDNRPYILDFADNPHLRGIYVTFNSTTQTPFIFAGSVQGSECAYFDANGRPFISSSGGSLYRLLDSQITLNLGIGNDVRSTRRMKIQPLSGLTLEI